MSLFTAIGLMSGTSLDGVDAALLVTDGENAVEPGPALTLAYAPSTRADIARAVKAAIEGRNDAVEITLAAAEIVRIHARAVGMLLMKAGTAREAVDIVGFHGQTLLHRPPRRRGEIGRSWQIGDDAQLAAQIGLPVVGNFRRADIEAGGEGAPLAPAYHAALARKTRPDETIAVLNLGGVSNLTFLPAGGAETDIIAFDCGPGNGLLDEWMALKTGAAMDVDGAAARAGNVSDTALRALLANAFLDRAPPKSLDRYDFRLDPVLGLSVADGAATLAAFTAAAVAAGLRFLPDRPQLFVVCGGGRRNPALMTALGAALPAPVVPAEAIGWRSDSLEAECFAYLAVRSRRGLPYSYPGTTGVPRPLTGGRLAQVQHRNS